MRDPAALAFTLLAAATAVADEPRVDVLEVEGPITSIVESFIERGIREAAEADASMILVRLDSPGGVIDVTLRISQSMQQSPVPICVWVAPKGAIAASAGTFVVLSGHKAAMAPGTSIGAASPIDQQGNDLQVTLAKKATNILVTSIRGLASRRGERAERWAEDAVRDAVAATAEEALEMGVIDVVAADRDELFAKLDGTEVEIGRDIRTLRTRGAIVHLHEMTWVEEFLHVIADPTIAYMLITLGMLGVIFELSNPGAIVPGVAGGIFLLFGFYAVGVLPVNYAGLLLMGLAFLLFIVDVKAQTHGALTIGGIVALAMGGMVLFQSPQFEVSREVIWTVAIVTGGFFAFAIAAAAKARLAQPATGVEGLVGQRGVVRTALAPVGMVMVEGELWRARAEEGTLELGTPVEVVAVDGMELRVRKAEEGKR